jgi:pyridoxal phosphate enzyme (YggS family)
MIIPYEEFVHRADEVLARIRFACELAGRDARTVSLLAVTKTHPAAAAEYAGRYGLRAVGENRVQEGVEKRAQSRTAVAWELIGHLQSNKARLAAQHFDRIQSVDSVKLVGHLDRAAGELGKTLPILLQVNAGQDPAKHGADPGEAAQLLEVALAGRNLRVDGLMTIAPLTTDPDVARRTFFSLRELRDRLASQFSVSLPELSMGMSGDLTDAIAAGSTIVRVGTALFGSRE